MIELSASVTPRARECPPSIRTDKLLGRLASVLQEIEEKKAQHQYEQDFPYFVGVIAGINLALNEIRAEMEQE